MIDSRIELQCQGSAAPACWFRSAVVAVLVGLSSVVPAGAQNDSAAAPACNGGPPGANGFRLRKAAASVAILEATQEQHTVSGQFIAQRNWNAGTESVPTCGWPYQRTLADFSATYDGKTSATGSLNVTRNYGAKVQQTMFLRSNASFAYLSADLYSNNSLGIKLTQSYGGGLGYARGPFEVDADLRFIDEDYLPPGDRSQLLGLGLGGRYDLSLEKLLQGSNVAVATTFVPVLNQSDSWLANGTLGLFLPFNAGSWGVTLIAQDNYVRNAPPGFRRNYFKTTIGLAYTPK